MDAGDVWMVSLPAIGGHEQAGERPAIVIQDAADGAGSPLVLVIPLTSRLSAARFPATVPISPDSENGLRAESLAMVFQVRALDRSRFTRRLGRVSDMTLGSVFEALDRLTGRCR